jgi:hypothetical protein
MNERIAKLYDQATILEGNGDYVAGELDPVKFAELIVRECGDVAYRAFWADPNNVRGRHIEEKIKQHFGVE